MSRKEGDARRLEVYVNGTGADARELAEYVCAEVWEAGAQGIVEVVESSEIMLTIYTRQAALAAVQNAAERTLDGAGRIGSVFPIQEQDWSEAWKEGIEPVEVSSRLVVRPTFVDFELGARQQELIIDPRQAFGTGGHASTFLSLEWIDALADDFHARTRVLDVGTGTGVLGLSALKLGAGHAIGFDIDPIAIEEAEHWAEFNGLGDRFEGRIGDLAVVGEKDFDLIVANLLRLELLPLIEGLAARLARGGQVVLSGLLAQDQVDVVASFMTQGIVLEDIRSETDDNGDEWVGLLLRRA